MLSECQDSFHPLGCIQLHRVRAGEGGQLQTDRVVEEVVLQNPRDEAGPLLRRGEVAVSHLTSPVVQTLQQAQGEHIIEEELR